MKTPNYDFSKDLPIAKKTQKQIAEYLVETQNMKFIGTSDDMPGVKRSDFDICMQFSSGTQATIEVKEDFTCERTGNVGVEYESWGRASGINISKADFYLYKIHMPNQKIGAYIIKTDKLKEMIKDKLYFRTVVGGDPGSNSKNYLFKLDVVKENFKFIGFLSN
jgi:hypothetical protein